MTFASSLLLRLACVGALLLAPLARADSWRPPSETTTLSAAGTARVTVTPRALTSSLDYFTELGKKAKPAQAPGADHASARVERKGPDGGWTTVWEGPLLNEVGPVFALVSDDGTRLVTFDNWHAVGYGEEVVAIYDASGSVVRQWSLEKMLPAGYVQMLPHSVSSIGWRGNSTIVDDGATLRIDIVEPGVDFDEDEPRTAPLSLRLADGMLLPDQDPKWVEAVRKLAPLAERRQRAWDRIRASRAGVLVAPESNDANAWRAYLVNARHRLSTSTGEHVSGWVLEAGDDEDYSANGIVGSLDDYAAEPPYRFRFGDRFVFVSPQPERLVARLSKYFARAKRNSFAGVTVWIPASQAQVDRVQLKAANAGVRIERIDPAGMAGVSLPAEPPEFFQEGMEE